MEGSRYTSQVVSYIQDFTLGSRNLQGNHVRITALVSREEGKYNGDTVRVSLHYVNTRHGLIVFKKNGSYRRLKSCSSARLLSSAAPCGEGELKAGWLRCFHASEQCHGRYVIPLNTENAFSAE